MNISHDNICELCGANPCLCVERVNGQTNNLNKQCLNCDLTLGQDCGDAEPDYDENYCSEGCYNVQNG